MNTNQVLWLSLAVAGIVVVATMDNEASPEVTGAGDKPIEEPKKVVL